MAALGRKAKRVWQCQNCKGKVTEASVPIRTVPTCSKHISCGGKPMKEL